MDVDFLNSTSIPFEVESPSLGVPGYDSGWRDIFTGARILSKNDTIVFTVCNLEEELVLKLKFDSRLTARV